MKGSGRAADLLADVVILTDARSSDDIDEDSLLQDNLLKRMDQAQAALKDVLHQILATPAGYAAKIDTKAVVKKLKEWEEGKAETDIQRRVDVKLRTLFCESYGIVRKGKSDATPKHLYKYLRESLEAVDQGLSQGLVFVFDLKNSSADFNRELLKCALKSIDSSSSASDSLGQRAWYKLKFTMRARDDLIREQLMEVLNEGVLNGF